MTARLAHQWYVPGALATWTAAESLGGALTSQPAVASWAAGRYDVFARGTDNAVWHKWFSGGNWSGWQSLGEVASSSPAAAAWGPGRLDLFVRGTNNQLYTRHYATSTGWSGWTSLGGVLTSGPAAASWGSGRLDVFVRGTDNAVWHKWFSGGKWSGWQSLGGRVIGEPGAASTAAGKLDLFARGTGNALLARNYNVTGAGWSAWTSLGGTLTSSPSATVPAAGVMTVFVGGSDGRYYYRQRPAALVWSPGWQAADAALAFRGLGAWVDVYDYPALSPATAVADLQAHGVRTLYLGTARYDSAADILYPDDVAAWLAAAHAAGIRVVGWYVPDYADLTRDVRRTLAIATYVSPAGQRFDAIGIDIEYLPAGAKPDRVEPGGRDASGPGPRGHRAAGRGNRAAAGAHAALPRSLGDVPVVGPGCGRERRRADELLDVIHPRTPLRGWRPAVLRVSVHPRQRAALTSVHGAAGARHRRVRRRGDGRPGRRLCPRGTRDRRGRRQLL